MRFLVTVAAALALSAGSAAAEFPLTLDAQVGLGIGFGHHRGSSTGPFGGFAALDLTLDRGSANRWFVSGLASGIGAPGGRSQDYLPDTYRLDSIALESVIAGVERTRNDGGAFVKLGAGASTLDLTARDHPDEARWGLALGAHAGVRLIPPPGPVGFLIGVRSHHVIGSGTHANVIALVIGLSIAPR